MKYQMTKVFYHSLIHGFYIPQIVKNNTRHFCLIYQLSPKGEVNSGGNIYLALGTDPEGDSFFIFTKIMG